MIGLLLIYFVGEKFYKLASLFNRNKWGYTLLGIAAYYAGTIFFGVIFWVAMGLQGYSPETKLNSTIINIITIPFGLLVCYGVYTLLKKQWEASGVENPDILDDLDRHGFSNKTMADPVSDLLPTWYLEFLNTYDTLKNDVCTYYLGINLEKIHGRLATCTLLRLDDRNSGRYLSIDKQTERARQYLRDYFPNFPFTEQCVAIAWNGYCNVQNQWESNSVILVVKEGEKRSVYAVDIDSMMEPVPVSKDFDAFFVNLNETVENARIFINERTVPKTRKNGELIPVNMAFQYVDVELNEEEQLDNIIKPQYYVHFDAEGFINTADYEDLLKKLLDMTGLDYRLAPAADGNMLDLHISSKHYHLQLNMNSDYFDETLHEQLNTILADWKLKKKFQMIYPYTTGNADQTIAIGYCSDQETDVLRKNRYVL